MKGHLDLSSYYLLIKIVSVKKYYLEKTEKGSVFVICFIIKAID